MESYFQEVEGSSEIPSSRRSSESDDSQRLVIVEDTEDLGGPQGGGNIKRRYTYEEYKKMCLRDFLLKKLTFFKLKRLMALYYAEISEKSIQNRKRCITSWKTAKVMAKTLMMFHLMFEEIKENITLDSIYYQRMSDLISIYIDFEIKASESSVESAGTLSSRIISMMEKCLDQQHRFTLDTLLKSNNICNKFQEISKLLISRVVRGLPATTNSEQSFIRAMLVFKLWIQITNDVVERSKILKLASHLAKPPEELLEEPSKFAKDIIPCNFRKCYIDFTTYIIGTPWPLRKKIKTFLEHTRIFETSLPKGSILKPSHMKEERKDEELADVKALKDVHLGLKKIILLEKNHKKIIRTLKNSHYKYAPSEEFSERCPMSFEYIKISKEDTSNPTLKEKIGGFPLFNSKVFHEFLKQIFVQTDIKPVQNPERGNNLPEKILAEVSVTNEPNYIRDREIPHESIPKDVTNLLNFDSTVASKKKTISVSDYNPNRKTKKNTDEMVSTISVRPPDTISYGLDNASSKATADWHTPELHCQAKVSSSNPPFPSYRAQMISDSMSKGPTNQDPSVTSTLPLLQGPPSIVNDEQPNSYGNLLRSTDSLLQKNITLPPACINHNLDSNLRKRCSSLNKRAIQRMNHSFPISKDIMDDYYVRNTTINYYAPSDCFNPGPFFDFQGMNSVQSLKDRNHPMLFDQHRSRPHYSQIKDSFSFYDDDTIAKSTSHLMGTQSEGPNCSDLHPCMANSVQPDHPLPLSLPAGNNDELASCAMIMGRGSRHSSTAQHSYRKKCQDLLGNIAVSMNPTSDNQNVQRRPNIPSQKYNNSFRTLDSNYTPNSNAQLMFRHPAPTPNIIQNDPKLVSIRLPPYSSIRRKNNRFNPTLPITDAPSNSLPANTARNSFPNMTAPMVAPVNSSHLFSPAINNSFSSPVINIPSSLPPSNVGPLPSGSGSFSAARTSETHSEVTKSNNCHRTHAEGSSRIELYQNLLNIVLHKVIIQLTHKNNHGFLEYNFVNMPNNLQAFKDALLYIEKFNGNNNTSETIDDIVTLLSKTNENVIIDKNMFPPQLLKVNNIDIKKGKFNIEQDQKKRHEATLNNDYLAFVYQDKIRNFYSDFNGPSDNFLVKSDLQTRCYCLQCCANKIVLDVNNAILTQFRHYLTSSPSVYTNENEQNQHLMVAGISKRSLEKSVEERDSPLPLKKRITSTPPNDVRSIKDSEVSYPSTPMISIAELELMKDISTNVIDHKTDKVDTILNSNDESQSSEICKNINQFSTNKAVPEAGTYHNLENNESKVISTNNNLLKVETCQNPSRSAPIEYSVIQPSKSQVKNKNRKSVGRPRKNAKKN